MPSISSMQPVVPVAQGAFAAPDAPVAEPRASSSEASSGVNWLRPGLSLVGLGGVLAAASRFLPNVPQWQRSYGGGLGLGVAALGAIMVGMNFASRPGPGGNAASGAGSTPGSGAAAGRPLEFNQERREGPTPSGGAYSIASYFDGSGQPAAKDEAQGVRIVEYSASGESINSTSATIGGR